MKKPLDLLTREGLDQACSDFEKMGKDLSPVGVMVASASAEQTRGEMDSAIKNNKRPGADVYFREFFFTLMIISYHQQELQQ